MTSLKTSVMVAFTSIVSMFVGTTQNVYAKEIQENSFVAGEHGKLTEWPEACQKFIQRFSAAGNKHLHFSDQPKPKRSESPAWWLLQWQGVTVPIPDIPYKDLIILDRKDGVIEFMLMSDKGIVTASRSMLDTAVENYFATVDVVEGESRREATDAGRAMTRHLFGGPVSLDELMMAAYRYRLEDITCQPENKRDEVMAVYGLPLAMVAGPYKTQNLYRNVGKMKGWLSEETDSREMGRVRLWRALTVGSEDKEGLHIEVLTVDEEDYKNIGLEIGEENAVSMDTDPPQWLIAMQKTLDEDSEASWLELKQAVKLAGMSHRSIASLERFITNKE